MCVAYALHVELLSHSRFSVTHLAFYLVSGGLTAVVVSRLAPPEEKSIKGVPGEEPALCIAIVIEYLAHKTLRVIVRDTFLL